MAQDLYAWVILIAATPLNFGQGVT